MLHASTSPFYPLFASLDVGAQMMKGKSGEVLWDDTIRLGIEIRKKMRAIRREFEDKESDSARCWFFEPFVADRTLSGERDVAWEDVPTDELARDANGRVEQGLTLFTESIAANSRMAGSLEDAAAIVAQLKSQLANFKIPKKCFVVPELPRNTMGKVQKNLLRDQHKGLFA